MHAPRFWNTLAMFALGAALATFAATQSADAQSTATPSAGPKSATADVAVQPVDLNGASEADFERLPGIGPSRAKAIVDLRDQLKGFRRIEDLMRVKGIGRKTFQKLVPMVTLGTVPPTKVEAAKKDGAAKP